MAPPTTSPSDRCPSCGRRAKRSTDANRRYWKIVYKVADEYKPDGKQFGAQTWHLQFRKHWLGATDVVLPTGETLTVPTSSSDLEPEAFSDYMTAVEEWANSRGVWLDE